MAVTVAALLAVNVHVLVLLPPLLQAPDQMAEPPFETLKVIDVLLTNDADPLLPVETLMPAGDEATRSPLRPDADTVMVTSPGGGGGGGGGAAAASAIDDGLERARRLLVKRPIEQGRRTVDARFVAGCSEDCHDHAAIFTSSRADQAIASIGGVAGLHTGSTVVAGQ